MTNKDFEVRVSTIDKKKSNTNNSIRGSKNDPNDDVIEKLKKVFKEDLIIEQ